MPHWLNTTTTAITAAATAATHLFSATQPLVDPPVLTNVTTADCFGDFPVLYKAYKPTRACPPVNNITLEGTCTGWDSTNATFAGQAVCSSFCETTTTWSYLPEVPIADSYCVGPSLCTVAPNTPHPIHPASWKSPPGISKVFALEHGIRKPWLGSERTSYANLTQGLSIEVPSGTCGYWTYVPIRRQVCGVMTTGMLDSQGRCTSGVTEVGYCSDSVFESEDSLAYGMGLFIETDCATQEILKEVKRNGNAAFRVAGVELGKDTRKAHITSWVQTSCQIDLNMSLERPDLLERFEIFDFVATLRGKAMAHEIVGADGSNLKAKMGMCGSIVMFEFEWLGRKGKKSEWEWVSRFVFEQNDLSTIALEYARHCVGSILLDVGGWRDECYFHGLPYDARGNALMQWL